MALGEFSKVYVEISATADKLVNEVGKANKSLTLLEKTANRISTTFQGILVGRGVFELIMGFSNAVRTLAEFDQSMTQVKVITGATNDEFRKLESSALKLGSTTQYTAKQVAELQLEFGRLGFSTREILDATKATVDLATATGEGLARSAEIAGSTLRAFGLDSKEMTRVTDVMAASMNKSALTLDSFAEGIKYVAPVAAASNITIEETAAMLSVLADAGIKGSQAGTSLRRIFTMLTKDGKPLQDRLAELAKNGISLASANDEVGLYAQTALLVLGRMLPVVNELTGEFNAAAGSTNEMARAMEDNLATSLTKVSTSWDAFILSFKNSKGDIKDIADLISGSFRLLANSDKFESGRIGKAIFNAATGDPRDFKQIQFILNAMEKDAADTQTALDNLISDSATVLLKDYGYDLYAIQNALYDNVNATKILEEVERQHKKTLQETSKEIVANANAIDEKNKKTKEEIRLAYELSEIQRQARIAKLERRQSYFADFNPSFTGTEVNPAFNSVANLPINDNAIEAQTQAYTSMNEALSNLSETTKNYGLNLNYAGEAALTKQEKLKGLVQSMEQVGDSISRAIAKDESLGKSIAAVTATIVEEMERQALAILIRNALAGSLKNPIAAIGGAIAGFSIIKGLFAKISKGKDGSSSANVGQGATRVNLAGGASNVNFVIRGENLYGVLSNYERNSRQTSYAGG